MPGDEEIESNPMETDWSSKVLETDDKQPEDTRAREGDEPKGCGRARVRR